MTANVKSYRADVSFLLDEEAFSRACARLPRHRQDLAQSFYFAKDRALSAGAWMLLAHAMSAEGVDVSCARLVANPQGKPSIPGAPHFNLSHSGSMVMCTASADCAVGCDVQTIEPWDEALARTCMQPAELEEMRPIATSNPPSAAHVFFRRWTIKESYMKARGLGFMLPPESFAVDLTSPNAPQVIADTACAIAEFHLNDGYCYAACSLDPLAHFEPLAQVQLA